MKYQEINDDIIKTNDHAIIISLNSRLQMDVGIAKIIKNKYGRIEAEKNTHLFSGDFIVNNFPKHKKIICCLITKYNQFSECSYSAYSESLKNLITYLVDNNIKDVSLPRIGCGLDKMDWSIMKNIILTEFANTDINVSVYCL